MSNAAEMEQNWPVCDDFLPLKDGTIMAVKRGIAVKKSTDGGKSWGEWSEMSEIEGNSISLLRLTSGEIGMIYHTYSQPPGKMDVHKTAVIYFRKSSDEGKTWSPPVQASPQGVASHAMPGSAIELKNGKIIVPASTGFGLDRTHKDSYCYARGSFRGSYFDHESHGHEALLCVGFTLMSDDSGDSWHRSKNGEIIVAHNLGSGLFGDFEENYVVELTDNRLMMFGRNCLGRVFKSYSEDRGETWHLPVPTNLAASAAPPLLKNIPGTDHLLVVWNQVSADEIRRGLRRARLSTAVSTDNGETWEHFRNLECNGVEELTDIKPEAAAHVCALNDSGNMPDDYILCSYPNVGFYGNFCVINYKYFEPSPKGKRMSKVRILPVEWFYGN